MIGWLDSLLEDGTDDWEDAMGLDPGEADSKQRWLRALSLPPRAVGRGMSEALSLGSDELARRLEAYDELAKLDGYDIVPGTPSHADDDG
jgi:hypothetical protein